MTSLHGAGDVIGWRVVGDVNVISLGESGIFAFGIHHRFFLSDVSIMVTSLGDACGVIVDGWWVARHMTMSSSWSAASVRHDQGSIQVGGIIKTYPSRLDVVCHHRLLSLSFSFCSSIFLKW